jgi:hypothetical protein
MSKVRGGDVFLERIKGISEKLDRHAVLKVGFLSGATYPDSDVNVPTVAAINEFGAPSRGQPPRPFFRNMIAKKKGSWGKAISKLLKENEYSAEKTLRKTGEGISGQLKQSIHDLTSPPLKQSTIDRKGFNKPLISTGHMLNSVDYEVDI